MEQKGSMLLKVISIIMIVAGIITAVMEIVAMAGLAFAENLVNSAGVQTNTGALWAAIILGFIGVIAEIVGGFIGLPNWQKPEKAQTMIIVGVIAAVFALISNIFTMIASSFNFLTLLSGLVVPVLYIVGAYQLKNQK